jgi:hypothetical protein
MPVRPFLSLKGRENKKQNVGRARGENHFQILRNRQAQSWTVIAFFFFFPSFYFISPPSHLFACFQCFLLLQISVSVLGEKLELWKDLVTIVIAGAISLIFFGLGVGWEGEGGGGGGGV